MIKHTSRIIALICLTQAPFSWGQNFIFDFNGVLMGTDTLASFKHIGLKTIVQCMLHLRKGFTLDDHLKQKLFVVLDNVAQEHGYPTVQSICACEPIYACDENGNMLPYLMQAWLDGSMTCNAIKKITFNTIELHPEWFDHAAEKQAVCNALNIIFTPQHFAQTRMIHHDCVNFIKACKKRGHKVYALSNWDKESFPLLQEKYADVFGLFDGIIISGEVNALKPAQEIYTLLLNRYNLKPDTCWFIDDQVENIAAASKVGIHSIRCFQKRFSKRPNFRLVAQTIKERFLESQI